MLTAALVTGLALPFLADPGPAANAVEAAVPAAAAETPDFKVMVFTKTAGFAHSAIPTATAAIQALGAANNFGVDTSADAAIFDPANAAALDAYDAIIFNSTTGDFLNAEQQLTFESYIRDGGGYVGLHAASDAEYDWPWYNQLVGAYFDGHPAQQNAKLKINDRVNESTKHLTGDTWTRFDEWYNYKSFQADKVHVLLSLDETSYVGGNDGVEHPISWCQEFDGGRSWYTGLGHTEASYAEPGFLDHLLGGIKIAAAQVPSGCSSSQSGSYEKVTLDQNTDNPMALTVVQDGEEKGNVFFIERNGRVQRLAAGTNQKSTTLTLPVTQGNEDGLLGMVLDPDFAQNGWAYMYWAPDNVGTDGPHNRISRYTYDFTTDKFDAASEKTVLKVTTQRNTCCHAGGDMLFDNDGNLLLATGDNTNPFQSDGYAPIDERAGRQDYDAQRTSANTNDLRGKLIRITPTDAGSYDIPAGNLFDESADASSKTRPEIYAMGFRNPFRMGLDPKTNNILLADYGPDAGGANASRGPGGTVEWNIVDEPGNYGWPLVVGVKSYNDFDFATRVSGAPFSQTAPINNSPNNTGLTTLPPVKTAELWMENGLAADGAGGPRPPAPEIGGSGAPMGGPAYDFDPDLASDTKWPEYWDGRALFGEWNQGKMYSFQLNREAPGATGSRVVDIDRTMPAIFDPGLPAETRWNRSMDFEFGPDGALYIIDWGSDFGGSATDSGIYRIDYTQGNPSPIARASADVTNTAETSLEVNFSSAGTRHPLAKPMTFLWNFGDGQTSTEENPTHLFTAPGQYDVSLTVTDVDGKTAVATVPIIIGNAKPEVSIVFPENGGVFEWGDTVSYKVIVNDPDADGPIDCSQVRVLPALGHDSHNHDFGEQFGCEGTFETARDSGHGLEANLFWLVNFSYVDDGGAAGAPLTGFGQSVLNPSIMQAEYFDQTGKIGSETGGVQTEVTSDTAGGGRNVSYVDTGDWWSYEPFNLVGLDSAMLRVAKGPGGQSTIEARWNDPEGPTLATFRWTPTVTGWQVYQDVTADFVDDLPSGTGTLYFVMTEGVANINYMHFSGDGVISNTPPQVTLDVDTGNGTAPVTVAASATAVDPDAVDGDGPITYSWDMGTGAGFQAGTENAQFVYDQPGQYELTVKATDAAGASSTTSQLITVLEPSGMCFSGRSDDFVGTSLDTERWSDSVRINQSASVADGVLTIPAVRSDIHGAGGTTPNIVLQDAPDGAWTATAKLSFEARIQWQQAGLIVYENDDNYVKFVQQGRSSTPDAGARVFQFLKEDNAAPQEINTPAIGALFPDDFFVRITSDGTTLTSSYSTDGINYTAVNGTFTLAGIDNPKIGLFAAGSLSTQTEGVTPPNAEFDWFSITPDDTATADTPNDEFDGTALSACRWSIVNQNRLGYRVSGGNLEIDTMSGDIYQNGTPIDNIVLQPQPEGDWTVETKVDATDLDRRYQQGGIILYGDDQNYVKLDILSTNAAGSAITRGLELRSEVGGAIQNPQPSASAPASGVVWLRLAKSGTTFTGSYSSDGQTWTTFQSVPNAGLGNAKVGVYALGNAEQGQVSNTAKFDYFRVLGVDELTVDATVDPAAPNGANGWYTGAVAVSVNVEGGSASSNYREVNIDGAGWVEYTTPVSVSTDGEHTVEYRASAPGAETVSDSVSFKIDASVPTASAVLAQDVAPRTVTLSGDDATSGVASQEYRLGDGAWQAYSSPVALDDSAQVVSYRVTDVAGNVSQIGTLDVPLVEPEDPTITLEVTVAPDAPNGEAGWYTRSVTISGAAATTGEAPASVEYSTDGVEFTPLAEPLEVTHEGETTVWLRATDGEFFSATEQRTVKIDTVDPSVAASAEVRQITLSGEDATSGLNRIEYRIDDAEAWLAYTVPFTVPGTAAATVESRSVDNAGNVGDSATVSLEDITPEPVVETVITGAPGKTIAKYGSTVKYSGQVVAADKSKVVGTVEIRDGSTVIATIQLKAADKGKYSVNLPTLSRGVHHLSATFIGNATYGGSTNGSTILLVN